MSQNFLLRLPEAKMLAIKKIASKNKISINKYLNDLLDKKTIPQEMNGSYDDFLKIIKSSPFFKDIKAIILFGSVAKGIENESSDCDILLVMSDKIKISRSLYTIWDNEIENKITPEMSMGKEISPHFVSLPKEVSDAHSLWLEVAISGILLWRKDLEIEFFLQNIRSNIANGNLKRKLTYGQPYWIRTI
jgi:predicted nucleotidyltransferase